VGSILCSFVIRVIRSYTFGCGAAALGNPRLNFLSMEFETTADYADFTDQMLNAGVRRSKTANSNCSQSKCFEQIIGLFSSSWLLGLQVDVLFARESVEVT